MVSAEDFIGPKQFTLPLIEECLGNHEDLSVETIAMAFDYVEKRCAELCTLGPYNAPPDELMLSYAVAYPASTGEDTLIVLAMARNLQNDEKETRIMVPAAACMPSSVLEMTNKYVYTATFSRTHLMASRSDGIIGSLIPRPSRFNKQKDLDLFMDTFRFIEAKVLGV